MVRRAAPSIRWYQLLILYHGPRKLVPGIVLIGDKRPRVVARRVPPSSPRGVCTKGQDGVGVSFIVLDSSGERTYLYAWQVPDFYQVVQGCLPLGFLLRPLFLVCPVSYCCKAYQVLNVDLTKRTATMSVISRLSLRQYIKYHNSPSRLLGTFDSVREMEAKTLPKMRTAAIAVHRTWMRPPPAAAAEVEPRRTGGSALAAS